MLPAGSQPAGGHTDHLCTLSPSHLAVGRVKMPGFSPSRAPASLHVGADQVGLGRAAGLQLPAQSSRRSAGPGCPGASCQGLPQEDSPILLPNLPEPDHAVLPDQEHILPMEGEEEEVAKLEQSFPSAPYIYCKVLWL